MRNIIKRYDKDSSRVARVAKKLAARRGEECQATNLTPEMGQGHISFYLYLLVGEQFNRVQRRTLYIQLDRSTGRIKIYKV